MNKLLAALTAASTLALAAPAAAQYDYQTNANAGGAVGIHNRIARLEARIDAGVRDGTIDRYEARSLRQQLRSITRLERQYSRNGLNQQERADLQQRVRSFRDQLRLADGRTGDGRYANNDVYDDGYYGQGGPYEEVDCDNNGGLGGILDSIFGGGDKDCRATLRVGQRAHANLGSVPYEYRNQYRDGNGVYYRSDGRAIYQIDARTHTVIRIYGMNR